MGYVIWQSDMEQADLVFLAQLQESGTLFFPERKMLGTISPPCLVLVSPKDAYLDQGIDFFADFADAPIDFPSLLPIRILLLLLLPLLLLPTRIPQDNSR